MTTPIGLPEPIRLRPASTYLLLVLLGLLAGACSTPVEPVAEPPLLKTASAADPVGKTMPVLEVTCFMWSEKGLASEVDVTMWIPEEGFKKERVLPVDEPMQRTIYIPPNQYRGVDFAVCNRTAGTLVRALIQIEGEVVAHGHAEGVIPLAALDARAYTPETSALASHR